MRVSGPFKRIVSCILLILAISGQLYAQSGGDFLTPEEKENLYREKKVKKSGRFSMGVMVGVIPDLGNMSSTGPKLRKINQEMARVVSLYNQTAPSSLGSDYILTSSGELTGASKAAVGIPVGLYFYYNTDYLMFRTGLNYTFSTTSVNEFVGKQSLALNPNCTTCTATQASVNSNKSGLDTAGEELKITSKVSMTYLEVPFTVALRLVNIWGSSLYFGGGPSLFAGGWKRQTISNNIQTVKVTGTIPDVDVFSATTLGFHFLIGGEVYVNSDISLVAEFSISQGIIGLASDRVISKNIGTLKTQASDNLGVTDAEALKVGAEGQESGSEAAGIQFGGIGMSIGIRYLL